MDAIGDHQLDFSIVSPRLTVEAMRDSGYKDTDHAIAELVDNSIEAKASLVELVAVETPPDPDVAYARARVSEIAVGDDGEGMDAHVLRRALRFGDGTRLDRKARGIGRFGVGLPNSSISQCKRVDVWSWQNGADNALHCFLDLGHIRKGETDVPEPTSQPVPERWRSVLATCSEPTGTLVVWSELDRVRWRGGEKTLERTEELCGRLYRKFLTDSASPVEITLALASDDGDDLSVKGDVRACLPNDPLYLITPSSTPPPFDNEPMFRLFNERTWTISVGDNGDEGDVHVRCAMARPGAINEKKSDIDWPRSYTKAGSAPWGKHADRNKGVSIVRARRELELSQAWVNSYEPEERWWSVEIEFDPLLDEIFGVVNNKQHAHAFVSGAGFSWEEAADPGETFGAFTDRLEETADPRRYLIEIWNWIDDQIQRMRAERKTIMRGTGSGGGARHPSTGEDAEDVATNVINTQASAGETGTSDTAPPATDEEKINSIADSATQVRGVDPDTAKEWAEATVTSGRRVLMKEVTLGHGHAFFDVESVSDVIEVWLNDKHPVYEHFIEVITADSADQELQELQERLDKAAFTLRMLLFAWARYEDKAPMNVKEQLEDIRMDWGREARRFFDALES
jgi:hypothetical protein